MNLEPLTLVPTLVLRSIPDTIASNYMNTLCDANYNNNVMPELLEYINKRMQDSTLMVTHVAMCTPRMYEVYKADQTVASSINLTDCACIYDFLADTSEAEHVLHRRDTSELAEALITYVSMLPTNASECELIRYMGVHLVSNRRRSPARERAVLSIAYAWVNQHKPEHDIYFNWLKEYGED